MVERTERLSAGDDALELRRWGTRFLSTETEARYGAWHLEQSIPFNRAGLAASIGMWIALIGLGPGLGFRSLVPFAVLAALLVSASLALTYRRSYVRWMLHGVWVTHVATTLLAVWLTRTLGTPVSALIGTAIIANYFGFAVIRLRPLQAILGTLPCIGFAQARLAESMTTGHLESRWWALDTFLLSLAFFTGILINVVFDISSRRSYRQERIIEAQKARIEQAEAALQRELSHQVAERSREIGAAPAQKNIPIAPLELSPGTRFDARYEIVRALGEGGMGAVYEVRRLTDGQSLALKVVTGPISRTSAQRFAREAEIGARLRHENLVPIVDVGISPQGAPFLVMELVKGAPLEARRQERFGDASWAIPILRQIAHGLAALHDADVVHRDLKPGNVLLSGDDESPLVRIADFGISRMNEAVYGSAPTAAKLTATNGMIGTPLYMAPELGQGHTADAAADIFAFGIVAYELLTGRLPFAMPPLLLTMAGHALPTPPSVTPEIVLRCLLADPKARPCAKDLGDAFAREIDAR